MPTSRFLIAVFLALPWVASCVQPEASTVPPVEDARFGVQILNGLPRRARIDVFVARSADGPWRQMHQAREVDRPREPVDPSLGGDPAAMRDLPLALDDGCWVVKVVETVSGRAAIARLRDDGDTWMIAVVGTDGITAVTDTGPRYLA